MTWKIKAAWTLAVLAVVIAIAAIAGYFYLQSSAFRQFAMRKIIAQADEATGGHTQIGAFDFAPGTLTAHLYDVVVRGKESPDAPPLLAIRKLTIGLKVQSILRRKLSLDELLIERPTVNLRVNSQGSSNMPTTPAKQSNGNQTVFDLAVRHVGLIQGEINYKDKKTPLDADLHDLKTDITFESLARRYSGSVSYTSGHLRYGQYAPLLHTFNVKFNATPQVFSLESGVLKVASSTVALRGQLANYADPEVSADYVMQIHTQDVAEMSPSIRTAGDVSLTGKLNYHGKNNQPFLRSLTIDGQVAGETLSAVSAGRRLDVRKLRGKFQLAKGSLRANGIEAELLGGRVSADAEVQNLDSTPKSNIRAALHNISLRTIQQVIQRPELDRMAISGTLDGTAGVSWVGRVRNLRARSDLTLRAAKNVASHSTKDVPVEGVIHAAYDQPANIFTIHQTTLRIPSARLTAEGQISKSSNLQLQAAATDLHQLLALVSALRSTSATTPVVSGSATMNATVQGSAQNLHVSGQVNAQNLDVQSSEWKSAELAFQADPSRLELSKGSLQSAQRGQASFSGTIQLRDWSYLPSNTIQAKLSLSQMPVADLEHLANVQYPVSGDLSANISVSGSQLDPKGSGSVTITSARAYDEPLQNLALTFRAGSGSVVSTLNVAASAGSATADLTYTPKTKAYQLRLDAPAIVLQKLHAVQAKNLAITGTLTVSVQGQGNLDDPQLTASIQLPKLVVQQKSISSLKAEVHVANKQADLTLDSEVAQAAVRARSHINLTGDYETNASIDTAALPLDVLLATYAPTVPEGFKGQTEFHATLKGPLKDKTKLEGHLTIPTLNASYQSLQIGAAGPIRADYSHSVLTLQPAEIRGTGTSIRIQGNVPLAGNSAPNLTAQGSIDAQILRLAVPDLQSSGTVTLDIRAAGSGSASQVQGEVHLQNIALATTATPLGIHNLNGTLEVRNDRVQISSLNAEAGGGQISAGGSVAYRPSLQFNVALQGKSVRLRYPDGLRTMLDSNLAWTGNMQASTLTGRVLIDALSFTPDFDLATFGDQFSSNAATPAQPGFADTVNLQVSIQSKGNLSANASQVSLEGDADLRVLGTAANPVIIGRTDLNAGELFYRNVRYQLQRGVVTFADPNQTKPVLNVSASTTVEQYNLTVNLRGPFDSLTVSYASDPPLPSADIINLIARGKTSSELAAFSPSTDSMVASQAASQVSGGLQKLAGISSLQIDPLLGGNNQNPSARVALQQRVTKNFLFTFSTDVSQPGSEMVQGEYQITKRWSVSMARDQLGGVSVDGRFHTKF